MCGIIAIIRRQRELQLVAAEPVTEELAAALRALDGDTTAAALNQAATHLESVNLDLRPVAGAISLVRNSALESQVRNVMDGIAARIVLLEAELDAEPEMLVGTLETINAAMLRLKDAAWAVQRDRLGAAASLKRLAPADSPNSVLVAMFSLHQALSSLDRLEVRGRDSAGIELVVSGHGLPLHDPQLADEIASRCEPTFVSRSLRIEGDNAVFVYKAAFEIGELGDNTAALREAIRTDRLLLQALRNPSSEVLVLGHTRWASVGIISEPNAHPQCSDELVGSGPLVTAVLNGDVDNHADLVSSKNLAIHPSITTDAKVIPAVVSRQLALGASPVDAFRDSVAAMEGSVAIGLSVASTPERLLLALRGSGQAIYIGLADDAFIVASEPYGVVEETAEFVRMDGETPSDPENPTATRGQIVELSAERAGTIEGIHRWSYDGSELPVTTAEVVKAEVTTRDIDRGEFPHYLLKEIGDAPSSFRKTLRGKLVEHEGLMSVRLTGATLSEEICSRLADGLITRVLVIGQGTAAIAGEALAHLLNDLVSDSELRVQALPATELSGFHLRRDMSDTLVVAFSQSGTTTDTNRTVDLIRVRGGSVIAVVNRRNSDLVDKSDGVLYTSDGRDVEMSVASTKAFYAMIAAGLLLASAISDIVPNGVRSSEPDQQSLLRALRDLPEAMIVAGKTRPHIAEVASSFAPQRRYWAIVGNGANHIAAREIRVKLSELCYKAIACDATEDKKHIDLSSEPLILVCASGLEGSTADDVGKEVAIFKAHKAAPIVIATEGSSAYPSALAVLSVPRTDPRLAFVLSTVIGHIFGYEAALAIDAQAHPLREARGAIERVVTDRAEHLATGPLSDDVISGLRSELAPIGQHFAEGLRRGDFNGHLEAGTAVRLAALFRYAAGVSPLDVYQSEFGKVGTPAVVLEDLTDALTSAIEELTRPVDAIKHQAKTVTVGISRTDESLMEIPLVEETLKAGAPRDRLSYSTLRTLAGLDPLVVEVKGFTRYRVENAEGDEGSAVVVDRGGVAAQLASRTARDPRLKGTKHLVAREKELMVARGRSDSRTVVIIPETKDGLTTGLTLLHVQFADRLPASTMRAALGGYRRRYQALRDAVTETEETFREDLLGEYEVIDLLCEPILDLADRWRP